MRLESWRASVLAVMVAVPLKDAALLPPLEVELKTVRHLHLRLNKETGMVLDRISMRQIQMGLQERVHQGQAVPRLQNGIGGGKHHGHAKEALVAMSLINSVETAVSIT